MRAMCLCRSVVTSEGLDPGRREDTGAPTTALETARDRREGRSDPCATRAGPPPGDPWTIQLSADLRPPPKPTGGGRRRRLVADCLDVRWGRTVEAEKLGASDA